MLCSTKDKTLRWNGKRLGISLLDNIYSTYVVEGKGILKIQPATPELVPYYTSWKSPSFPLDWYTQSKTGDYLVYFSRDNIEDEDLRLLISDLRYFSSLCEALGLDPEEVVRIPDKAGDAKSGRKEFLREKINAYEGDWAKGQLEDLLDNIDYFSVDEIRAGILGRGGKRRRKGTKRKGTKRKGTKRKGTKKGRKTKRRRLIYNINGDKTI